MIEKKQGMLETLKAVRLENGKIDVKRVTAHTHLGPFVDEDMERKIQRVTQKSARKIDDQEGITFIQRTSAPAYKKK